MLGKASDLEFANLNTFFGTYTDSKPMNVQLQMWRDEHPSCEIIQLDYKTYSATNADNEIAWGESVLITYKEG